MNGGQKPAGTLVCFALKEEAAAFKKLAAGKSGVAILVTGIGQKNSEKSLRDHLQRNHPQTVFTCGFAGGLAPELGIGSVVFSAGDAVLGLALTQAGALPVKFHCSTRIATTTQEKKDLRNKTGADVVEMESDIIHAVCREHGIPCATVRAISDTADEDMPLDFNQLAKPDLSMDYGKLAWAIMKSPGKIGALRRLQRSTTFAAEELAKVLAKVIWPDQPPAIPTPHL